MTGTSGPSVAGASIGRVARAASVLIEDSPTTGTSPVAASTSTTPERVEVGAPVDGLSARLLGRCVAGRADHGAGFGPAGLGQRSRQPEVGDAHDPVLVEQEVGGLDVAVHEAAVVRVPQRGRDLPAEVRGLRGRQPLTRVEQAAEAPALQELEDHEGHAVVLAPVVDGHHVRVVQRRGHLRLGPEATQEPGVVREPAVQHLHRDATTQAHVVGEQHPAARTGPDGREQPVAVREDLADEVGDRGVGHGPSRLRATSADPVASRMGRSRTFGTPDLASPHGHHARSARQPMFRHPWRIALVVGIVLVVANLGVLLLNQSDTTDELRDFPEAIDDVQPAPGELIRPQDTVTADLRDDLTGVLVLDGVEIPEDQTERVVPLGQVSFRPGEDKDLQRFEPGTHQLVVQYWPQGKARPDTPGEYGWTFRVGA